MKNAATAVAEPAAGTDVALFVAQNPVAVLTNGKKFDDFYASIEREVRSHVPDLKTDKGRKAIASLAFKVVKTKTALDDAGKKLTEDKRKEIDLVDAARRNIRTKLDALRDDVRKPLTDWEGAEERRVEHCQATLARLKDMAVVTVDDSSETVADRLVDAEGVEVAEALFVEMFEFATDAKARTLQLLTTGHARLLKEEADRAELARLRAEAEERGRREAEERAAAEERARAEAEAKATEERRAAEAAEAEARARAAEQAEIERAAAEEARVAEDERRRAEDRAHRGKIMGEAKAAIIEASGVTEEQAKVIILAIVGRSVPHVTLQF